MKNLITVILLLTLFSNVSVGNPNDVIKSALPISVKSTDLIVEFEVGGGGSVYEKYYARPIVPAWQTTSSGVTVGIGVDVGHMTKAQVKEAMDGILPDKQIELLQSVAGLKGKQAYYEGLPKVKHNVYVSYAQAKEIFNRYTLPKFTKLTKDAFVLAEDRLHPHSNGALTSLVYNRGASMSSSSSRLEMRQIRSDIASKNDKAIPDRIRAMKRLWSYSALKGLHRRRDAEANLFQDGLNSR